ncbi:Mobile element protein [hydrothermal vent metagenome]|uniref:Mobile element protein n=1 Tax=hydrothermal vent metagenome TaxID=652676 RepID=A0A3B0ST72_9ZZZZ
MSATIPIRTDYTAVTLRQLAKRSKCSRQSRRLLSLAAVYDGMSRADAARIGGMDRQTLRDWVHRFNADGPEGLLDRWDNGSVRRLSPQQLDELVSLVQTGPDPETDGVVRWRRVDLKRVIEARFGVVYCERYVSQILCDLGFSHISARPKHPKQDARVIAAFKSLSSA